MIYLDTHVVVWLYAGMVEHFSEKAKKRINDHELFISPIVRLELQLLYEIQRITDDANSVLFDLSDRIGLKYCEKDFNTIVRAAMDCPWTRDPFDRIIVANAAVDRNPLVTKDLKILQNYENAVW